MSECHCGFKIGHPSFSKCICTRPPNSVLVPCDKLKEMQETIAEYKKVSETAEKYKKVLIEIANDYPELSHDKARMQNLDHIRWAKEVLK
jgi:hypothetical protein